MLKALGAIKRFAMSDGFKEALRPALAGADNKITLGSVAGRFAPDALFGVMAAMQTPGDAFDKGTAAVTSTLGGGLGGVAVSALTKGKLGMVGEMVGGMGGDYLGMMAGDAITRGKDLAMGGKGQTAWEKMGEKQQSEYAQQLEQQILAQYGLLPGTREQYAIDPSTGMGVA